MNYNHQKTLTYVFSKLDEKKTIKIIPINSKETNSIFYLNAKIIYLHWVKKSFKLPFSNQTIYTYKSFINQYF